MGNVLIGIEMIGKFNLIERWLFANDHFFRMRGFIDKNRTAELIKTHIAPTGNEIIGGIKHLRISIFIGDFRPANGDNQLRHQFAQIFNERSGFEEVPDIDAKSDHFRRVPIDRLKHLFFILRNGEF